MTKPPKRANEPVMLDAEARELLAEPRTIPLARLRLSYRTDRILREAGVTTLGELTTWSAAELLALWGFGQTCLSEVERMLQDFGLCLSPSVPRMRLKKQPKPMEAKLAKPETPRQQKRRKIKCKIGICFRGRIVIGDPRFGHPGAMSG